MWAIFQILNINITLQFYDIRDLNSNLDGVFIHTLPSLYSSARVTSTFRIDTFGFSSVLWELYNPGNSPLSLVLSNRDLYKSGVSKKLIHGHLVSFTKR